MFVLLKSSTKQKVKNDSFIMNVNQIQGITLGKHEHPGRDTVYGLKVLNLQSETHVEVHDSLEKLHERAIEVLVACGCEAEKARSLVENADLDEVPCAPDHISDIAEKIRKALAN